MGELSFSQTSTSLASSIACDPEPKKPASALLEKGSALAKSKALEQKRTPSDNFS
jgi:hypothetical protein